MRQVEQAADGQPVDAPGSAKALGTLLTNLPGVAYECSLHAPWTVFYMSAGVQALAGYAADVFTAGKLTWGDITHPDDLSGLSQIVEEATQAHRQFSASYRIRCASGEEKWVLETGEAIYTSSGAPTTIVGFIIDITHQKQIERKLHESEEHYRFAMDLNEHFPWATDADGAAVELSDGFVRLIGMSREEALGDGWVKALHPDDLQPVAAYWSNAVSSGSRIDLRFRMRHVNGEFHWYRTRAAPRRDAQGSIKSWHGTSENVDRQVEAEIRLGELQTASIHLSQDRAMSAMAATLAHELNQPLSAATNYLAGSARLVDAQSGLAPNQIKEGILNAAEQITRAGEIIRRVRAIVRHEHPKQEDVSIREMVERVAKLLKASGACPRLNLTLDVSQGASRAHVDQIQIEQVMLNLLRNACEAMAEAPSPSIKLSTERENEGFVRVTVSDIGTGLNEGTRDSLFEAYSVSKSGGLGVGLSISRTIVEAHGGRIWAENNAAGGASFMFTVPVA